MKLLLLLIHILFFSVVVVGQTVSGTVTDTAGSPLTGVSVIIKGTAKGVSTGTDGSYELSVPDPESILVFSLIGKTSQEVRVGNRQKIDILLLDDAIELDDIVVIGYGKVKKSDLTGSVSSLKKSDLNTGASSNIDQMLIGRAPGVQVNQNSSEPGGSISVQVRGINSLNSSTQPLYVIDGLPIDNTPVITDYGKGYTEVRTFRNPLNSLNPSDIESVEILKDASASAIYGSRGANGVVLITTKKGKKGETSVNYDTYFGVQKVANHLPVMSAEEYQTTLNELYDQGSLMASPGERVDSIQAGGTDWQDEIFRDAFIQNHNISFSGSSDKTTYYTSFNYFKQEGVVVSSAMERYAARLNLTHEIKPRIQTGINLSTSYVYDDYVPNGIRPNEDAGVISSALDFDPTLSVRDSSGSYQQSDFITKENPLAVAYGKNAEQKSFRTLGTSYVEVEIAKGLKTKLNGGGDVSSSRKDVFINSLSEQGRDAGGIGTIISALKYNYLAEGTVTYEKLLAKNQVNLLAGATIQNFYTQNHSSIAQDFTSEVTGTNSIQSGDQATYEVTSGATEHKLQSYLGRANYSYNGKYFLTASARMDGSSKFGKNNYFAMFPSGAVAWRLDKEDIVKQLHIFSLLKLRLNYGKSGNSDIPPYQANTGFSVGSQPAIFGDIQYNTMEPSRMPNPDLKWETTSQTGIAVDFGILNDRISGSVEYFYKKTTDMLMDIPVPSQTGFSSKYTNAGSLDNKGLEFSILTHTISTSNFQWKTNINGTYLQNKILDLGDDIEEIYTGEIQFSSDVSVHQPGETMNSYYGYEVIGVWQEGDDFESSKDGVQPGDFKYRDLNNDSTITADDRMIIGDPVPDFVWGLTNEFTYKRVSLSFAIQGVHGVDVFNAQLRDTYYPINFRRNKLAEPYQNRWTPENPTNEYPSFINPNSQGSPTVNTKTVEDASYIRIQNITIGYDVPLKDRFIRKLHFYGTVTNVYTFTDYSGYDPSANNNGTVGALRIDYNAYPLARTFMFGINATF